MTNTTTEEMERTQALVNRSSPSSSAETADSPSPSTSSLRRSMVPRGWTEVLTLGEGGFGEVKLLLRYKDDKAQQALAMKVLDTSLRASVARSAAREHRIHASLEHPNVVRFLGHRRRGPLDCLFLEFCRGGDLSDRLVPGLGLGSETLARHYFRQLAAAVEYLHSTAGVFHRDIKPENVLLDNRDNVKLADFGLAVRLRDRGVEGGGERLFSKRSGTRGFRAPEVLVARRRGTRRKFRGQPVDVWACGVVLVEMLTGTKPWERAHTGCQGYQDWLAGKTHLRPWNRIRSAPLSLLDAMLAHSPDERVSMADVMTHDWLARSTCTAS